MTTAEMMAEFRELVADELASYKISDKTVLRYLNEGQDKFCEDTGFFSDTTSFEFPTIPGDSVYVLDPRIIRVEDVFIGGRRLNKLVGYRAPGVAPEPTAWKSDTGTLTLWPTPDTAVTVSLHTWRYPLTAMTRAVPPSIPQRMQRACIEWAAFKCYTHKDVELEDGAQMNRHKANYRQYVLEGRALKRNSEAEQIVVGVNPAMNAGLDSYSGVW